MEDNKRLVIIFPFHHSESIKSLPWIYIEYLTFCLKSKWSDSDQICLSPKLIIMTKKLDKIHETFYKELNYKSNKR